MARKTLFCIVEGQTENAVLKRLIAPHLGLRGVDFHAPIVTIGKGRGGMKFLPATELYGQIRKFLKDPRQAIVTTLFDYYAFPTGSSKGWDYVAKSKSEVAFRGVAKVVETIEDEIKRRALEGLDLPNKESRLIPYIQLHELEALFFAEPDIMADAFGDPSLVRTFQQAAESCGGCENINDSPQTAPSKRIQRAYARYIKGRSNFAHGPRIAEKLDLATVRRKCGRFDAWLGRLELLAGQTT